MINPTTNYALADYVSSVNFGMIRGVRCMRINKTTIGIRLTHILYIQGVLRRYYVGNDYIAIYYKFFRSRHIIAKLKVISNLVSVVIENYKNYHKITIQIILEGFI
jgi:hypothetical protein